MSLDVTVGKQHYTDLQQRLAEVERERDELSLAKHDAYILQKQVERENQRLRQVLVTLQEVCHAEGHLAMITMLHKEVQALLPDAARREEEASHE